MRYVECVSVSVCVCNEVDRIGIPNANLGLLSREVESL